MMGDDAEPPAEPPAQPPGTGAATMSARDAANALDAAQASGELS
jgi:hypothetical protein